MLTAVVRAVPGLAPVVLDVLVGALPVVLLGVVVAAQVVQVGALVDVLVAQGTAEERVLLVVLGPVKDVVVRVRTLVATALLTVVVHVLVDKEAVWLVLMILRIE